MHERFCNLNIIESQMEWNWKKLLTWKTFNTSTFEEKSRNKSYFLFCTSFTYYQTQSRTILSSDLLWIRAISSENQHQRPHSLKYRSSIWGAQLYTDVLRKRNNANLTQGEIRTPQIGTPSSTIYLVEAHLPPRGSLQQRQTKANDDDHTSEDEERPRERTILKTTERQLAIVVVRHWMERHTWSVQVG